MTNYPSANRFAGARERSAGLSLKKYACRLPLALAARMEALCELHPQKTRSQIMADVLSLGLAAVAQDSTHTEPAGFRTDTRQAVYLLTGPFAEFRGLTQKHHLAMEQAQAKDEAPARGPANSYGLVDED